MNKKSINNHVRKWILLILLFLNSFIVSAIFRVRDYGSDTIDFQIMAKIVIWCLTLGFCFFNISVWLKTLLIFDNVFLIFFLLLISFSSFYSPSVIFSLGCSFSLIAVFCLLLFSSCFLERRIVLQTILASFTFVSVLSLIVYFLIPELGRLSEWESDHRIIGDRLSGITGAPNIMGFMAAFSLYIALYLKIHWASKNIAIWFLVFVVNILALLMSGSKTALIGLIVSLIFGIFLRISVVRLSFMFLSLAGITLVVGVVDFDLIFSMISRSGDIEEISSGTGRVFIWPIVIELISQKPLFGWGYASSVRVLPLFSDAIGHTPSHTHNMVLQILFSVGFIGLFLFIFTLAIKIFTALRFDDDFKIVGLVFIMVTGLAEAYVFSGVANQTTLVFATILTLDYRGKDETNNSPC